MKKDREIGNWIYAHSFECVVIMVVIVLIPYILVFAKNGISYQTQDWSYLGSYIGGTLGIVSIFLLFITYREQRRTNHIDHFEKVLLYHVNSIVRLQERNQKNIQFFSDKIMGIFLYLGEYEYKNEYNKEQAESVIRYTYSNILLNSNQLNRSIEELFNYIEYSLFHIEKDELIDEKINYAQEINIVLTLELKVVLICYVISNKRWDLLEICDKYGFFRDWNMENDMFNYIVSMFCNNSKSVPKPSESPLILDLFEIGDDTTFFNVLDHLQQLDTERERNM